MRDEFSGSGLGGHTDSVLCPPDVVVRRGILSSRVAPAAKGSSRDMHLQSSVTDGI